VNLERCNRADETIVTTAAGTFKVMADGYHLPIDPYLYNIGDLWGRGWSIIPLRERDKRPAIPWTPYQRRTPTPDELDQWFVRPERMNVGIVTGRVSGIFVVDADSPAALAWADEHLPPCDLRVRTAKGIHLYFPYSGDKPIRNKVRVKFQGEQIVLDVRADGGFVIGPNSIHPSDAIYTHEGGGW